MKKTPKVYLTAKANNSTTLIRKRISALHKAWTRQYKSDNRTDDIVTMGYLQLDINEKINTRFNIKKKSGEYRWRKIAGNMVRHFVDQAFYSAPLSAVYLQNRCGCQPA